MAKQLLEGIPDNVSEFPFKNNQDLTYISKFIAKATRLWIHNLVTSRSELEHYLEISGYQIIQAGSRLKVLDGKRSLQKNEVVLISRLKKKTAIIAKMNRFGDLLRNILDIWGYRIIVQNEAELEKMSKLMQAFWEIPSKKDLALRRGKLQYNWLRDYRKKDFKGLSPASSDTYDNAIHLNRRLNFGVGEFQIVTQELYRRAFLNQAGKDAHAQFAKRRSKLISKGRKW